MQTTRCVIPRAGDVDIERVTLGALEAGRVRVRTLFSLISPGTELAMFNGTHIGLPNPANTFAKFPFPCGYTAVGSIEESNAEGFAAGERVYFHGKHQGLQDVDPARQILLRVPDGVDTELVPFVRLMQIANTALVASEGARQDTVAVVGLGLVGNFAAQLYQRAGARVFAFDTLKARCDWARACGLANAVTVSGDLVEAVAIATGGKVPLAIEATGVGALVASCLGVLGDKGMAILLGSPRDRSTLDTYDLIHRPGARLVGAHERLLPVIDESGRDQRMVSAKMLKAIGAAEIAVRPLLSRTIAPVELAENYRALDADKERVLGVLVDWSKA